MDLEFSDEQRLIRDSAREFLAQACPPASVRAARSDPRGCPRQLWRAMAQLGWMGLSVPEHYGGSGAGFMELAVLLEETGRVCLPGPFFSTVMLGVPCLLELGNARQKKAMLPRLARGDLVLGLALQEGGGEFDPSRITLPAQKIKNGFRLTGTKMFVADASAADYLICVARPGIQGQPGKDLALFLVARDAPGLHLAPLISIDGTQLHEVVFDGVDVPLDNVLSGRAGIWPQLKQILLKATIGKCAQMVGGAQHVLDIAVSYAKEREQFNRPIGSFQAIQHHCVNMLIDLERARWLTYKSAAAVVGNDLQSQQASMTKAWCNHAYRRIVQLGHQVMGGVGYCEDHELPLYFRNARMAETAFGDSDTHMEIIADALLGADCPPIAAASERGLAADEL